ncbi:hypothetical protein ACFL5G_03900 [Candidatus Margulisiibacteriota bacterium]
MKKTIVIILALLFLTQLAFAAIPNKYVIRQESKLKYFKDTKWWLRQHNDIAWGTKFFYAPLYGNKLFSGTYYRFQRNELVMLDYMAKKNTSHKDLYAFLSSMGKVQKFQGIPYVKSNCYYSGKTDKDKQVRVYRKMAALLVSNKKYKRVIFVPANVLDKNNYKGSLLEAHIKSIYPAKKKASSKQVKKCPQKMKK